MNCNCPRSSYGIKHTPECFEARNGELETALDKRKAELWKYGKHLSACAAWKNMADGCTCGWATVRSKLAPEKQTVNDAFNAAIAPQADGEGVKNG